VVDQLPSSDPAVFPLKQGLSASVGNVGLNTTSFTVKFTPDDTANYNTVTGIKVHMLVKGASTSQDKTKTAASDKKQ
jgi:hypothetical protein